MNCPAHPTKSANECCSACKKAVCDACMTYDVDGEVACETCGREEEARASALGVAVIALVGVGYLATLAVGVVVFRSRPFVGGLAAFVAIAIGRVLLGFVKPRSAARRLGVVDATPRHR